MTNVHARSRMKGTSVMATDRITRRDFVEAVGISAGASALLGAPAIASAPARPTSRSGLILIGAGSRGNQFLDSFLPQPEVEIVGIVDVDDHHAGETADRIKKAKKNTPDKARDYRGMLDRKDVDAVIIATPDHWHALPAIQAVLAGKDVYVEKPVAHNVAEGQAMLRAARKTNKIMAVGTQQRSSSHFQKAVEIVRSGKLGKVFWVQTWNFENISPLGLGKYPDGEAPSYVDYERWLGPAPLRPFNPNRFHLLFRWFFDYAGGMMSDWGVHLNDIVLWALNAKGPKSVYTTGGIFTSDDNRDTPDTMQVVYEFPECTLTYSMRKGNGLKYNGHDYGILFCGTDGSLMLDRERLRGHPRQGRAAVRHQAGPWRSSAAEDRPEAREGQGRRRPGPPRPQLPRLRQVAGAADLRHRDRASLHQHLPPRQPLLQARAEARMGRRLRDLQERPGGQCAA